jgi:MFS family permease
LLRGTIVAVTTAASRASTVPGAPTPALPPAGTERLYYGWVILATLAVTEPTSWGVVYYAFGVLLEPMQREFGWDQAYLTGAFSLAVLVSAAAAVPVGRILDRHGARVLMTLGSSAAALLVVAWASVESLAGFYAVWVGLGVVMAAVLYEPAFAVLATWFERDRTRAMTLLTLAGALASPVFVPLTAWLAARWGWRTALVVLASILALVTIPPHALLLRRRPSDLGLRPTGAPHAGGSGALGDSATLRSAERSRVLRSAGFRWMSVAFWLQTFATMAVAVHLIPLLLDRGLGHGTAVAAAAVVGGMQIPGRVLLGPLERRVSARRLAVWVFLLQALGLVVLSTSGGAAGVFVFAALFGAGAGAATLVRATVVARLYGVENYGSISGVLAMFATTARAVAPLAASLGYGLAGGYGPVLWALVAVSLAAVGAQFFVEGRRDRRTSRPQESQGGSGLTGRSGEQGLVIGGILPRTRTARPGAPRRPPS